MEEKTGGTEFTVGGIIELELTELGLERKIQFQSPDNIQVDILPTESSKSINLVLRFSAKDVDAAYARSELELYRVSKMLTWLHEIKVKEYKINQLKYIPVGKKEPIYTISKTLTLKWNVEKKKKLDTDNCADLERYLSQEYPKDFEGFIADWYFAYHEQSKIAQYIAQYWLFYRLLERVIGKPQDIDDWIKKNEPGVQMVEIDRKRKRKKEERKKKVSIYTYLRDNIHPKKGTDPEKWIPFPSDEICNHLEKLRILVKKAIKEKTGAP